MMNTISRTFFRAVRRPVAVLGVVPFVLSGCLGLEPQPDRTRFYVLTAEAERVSPTEGADLAVRRLELPGYLDSSQIVFRVAEHEVSYRSLHRWGGALDAMLNQALTDALNQARPDWRVVSGPTTGVPLLLDIRVLRFEGGPGNSAHFAFEWELMRTGERSSAGHGRIVHSAPWNGEDVAALVAALADLIQAAAAELAEDLPGA